MTIRVDGIKDNNIVTVKMHCTHDWVSHWIMNMHCTWILRDIDWSNMLWRAHRGDVFNQNMYCFGHRPAYCWKDTYCSTRQKEFGRSIYIAATVVTNNIDLTVSIAPSRVYILKPSIYIAGWLHNILKGKYVLSKVWCNLINMHTHAGRSTA